MMLFFYFIFMLLLFFFSCLNCFSLESFYGNTFLNIDSMCYLDNFNHFVDIKLYSPVENYKFNFLRNSNKISYVVQNREQLEPLILRIEEVLNQANLFYFDDVSKPELKRYQIDTLSYKYKHLEYVLHSLYGYNKSEVYELVYRLFNGRTWYELNYLIDALFTEDAIFDDFITKYQFEFLISFTGYTKWCASGLLPL